MLKRILISAVAVFGIAGFAHADVHFEPKVGYSFNQHNVNPEGSDKDYMVYGAEVSKHFGNGYALGVEATQIGSDEQARTFSINGRKYIGNAYLLGGVGYKKSDFDEGIQGKVVDFGKFETPIINFGVGYTYPLTNMLSFKTELRTEHQTKYRGNDTQVLVGIDFNLNQLNKSYGKGSLK